MMKIVILILGFILLPGIIYARVTPEDIISSRKEIYQKSVQGYSPENREKLQRLEKRIIEVNKNLSLELERSVTSQAEILNEFERRQPTAMGVEDARYWVTFAHEAVAYQLAKIYIFSLTSENNLKNDQLSTINLFSAEILSTRGKVINSENTLKKLITKYED